MARGRPKKEVDKLLSKKFLVAIQEEKYNAMVYAARDSRTTVMTWVREAISEKLARDKVPIFGLDRATDLPNKTTAKKTVRMAGTIIAMNEIESAKTWEPIRTFIREYVEICKKHDRLRETLRFLKATEQPYFKRANLVSLNKAFKEEGFDGRAVLDALDALDWYNGEDPNATWGVADLPWLMTKKARQEEPNWGRLLKAWRRTVLPIPTTKTMTANPRAKEIVKELAEGVGAVEGSSDWARIEQFVSEKVSAHGIELVRQKASDIIPGPLGYVQFEKSFT